MLPSEQLRRPELRFCKVVKDGKRAFEKKFNTPEMAYPYTSCECFGRWVMSKGGNYGVLCGYGGLFVLDFDDLDTFNKVKKVLPPTFTVKSGGKKLPHMYYIANDTTEVNTVLFDDEDGNRIIDLQGQGKYVVGAGSRVNEGRNEYKVYKNFPITHVSYAHICSTLKDYFPHTHIAKSKKMPFTAKRMAYRSNPDDEVEKIKGLVSMPTLLSHYGSNVWKRRCECPMGHQSNSNATVAFDRDLMYCFHCCKGGDIFNVVMEVEGLGFRDAISWLRKTFNIK